mgnify:CR=1 FL=1
MSEPKHEINVKTGTKYYDEYNQYVFKLRHKRNWWWLLLLLLLPFLLFIKCNKDVTVTCTDAEGKYPIENQEVTLNYTAHFLYNNGMFFNNVPINITQETDSTGNTTFKDLPCSVFSYLFYCLQNATFTTGGECYTPLSVDKNFHYTWNVNLNMEPLRKNLYVKLLDKVTKDVLPDGKLVYRYIDNGEEKIDSAHADAAGVVTLPNMRFCSIIDEMTGICYGYKDETKKKISNQILENPSDSTALLLTPIMERFTFFVKNKVTKQPIPDALCMVSLLHPGNSKTVTRKKVSTSIDGKGIAVYDSAFVLSKINILATKTNYYDGELEGGPWTVENFTKQDDDTRTIWLEPKPYVQEFINIDSINGTPIPGAENTIRIISPDGKVKEVREIGNRNGVFPVSATEDDRVEIVSKKNNEYLPKRVDIPKFKDVKNKKIRMQPEMGRIQFRTVEEGSNSILPDCRLNVMGSISGHMQPTNSGNGVFTVNMRKSETLSIVASKGNYPPNTTKVRNARYNELVNSPQSRRDIPLKSVPPCGGGKNVPKAGGGPHHVATYGMGQMSGSSSIWVDFYSEADYLTIYDGTTPNGIPLVAKQLIQNKKTIPFNFTKGAVTIVIDSSDTSSWEYVVNCPD